MQCKCLALIIKYIWLINWLNNKPFLRFTFLHKKILIADSVFRKKIISVCHEPNKKATKTNKASRQLTTFWLQSSKPVCMNIQVGQSREQKRNESRMQNWRENQKRRQRQYMPPPLPFCHHHLFENKVHLPPWGTYGASQPVAEWVSVSN